ncbi:GLPGLI family protein [Epilithonimonas sp.]|uniref:GLPGLI family protein n=1 Tax=Epilithonimonas sp. TaxID=2894511 RepID=UPI0028A9984B|nr:GLPGLI family protein [Epilithonimonas sp.]
MKKIYSLLMITVSLLSLAQGTRIMYEYKFASNLEKKDSLETELMYLDIKKEGSNFYSRQKFVSDSTRDAYFKKQIATGSTNFNYRGGNGGKIGYSISKSYPDFNIVLHTGIGNSRFSVKNENPMSWKILPDKKTIDKFEVQKATLDFGGRTWTAWFSQDFPFQDGPYKFSGLPGLILEMEDSTGTHSFKFAGSKKFDEVVKIEKEEIGSTRGGIVVKTFGVPGGKEIEVSEEQFKKQWKEYKNDPVKDTRQMLSQGNMKLTLNIDGKMMSEPSEVLRAMEKNQREEIKNNNNKIEPALYP